MATGLADGIRLVATDLDGTLLSGGIKRVRPEAFPLIERVCDAGALFLAASGRQYASLRRLFAPVADRIGYLCENGALVVWQGETLVRVVMPRDIALAVCHMAMDTPHCEFIASGERCAYVLSGNQPFYDHLTKVVGNDVETVEKPEDIPEPLVKVAFQVRPEKNEEVRQDFERRFGDTCKVVTSGTEWIDVLMNGVNKGSALAVLGLVLAMPLADMAAFGDAENDREMLGAVGHPYLMDPCAPTMLDLAPRCQRSTSVEGELEHLLAR
ncbi:HAD-IIB family hydrolase [uncultured Parolsenella sp.]|uniref:HAD-IIB family hydrolase n=1 Tax=uncultured Parolsenella sp. TaxID=2083008 RepID=UPI0027D98696|nr:HAD-IIB family hydrolase [uncultured Parolsenella sp.]